MRTEAAGAAPNLLGTIVVSINGEGLGGGERKAAMQAMRLRYDLLRTAQTLLRVTDLPADKQHATCWCHRTSIVAKGTVAVMRAVDGSRARLGGVTTCGMVWTCPVCCAKIAERRRLELSRAMAKHIAAGGAAYLLTFTFPHDIADRLPDLMQRLDRARQRFQNSRTWKNWKEAVRRVGGITSLEVTYGHNGWHPHLHMLVFTRRQAFGEGPADPSGDLSSKLTLQFASLWVECLQRVGLCDRSQLADALKHAFNVRGGEKAAEYIAKYGRDERWGQSSELTRQHAKIATRRGGGAWHYTPFQLLQLIRQGCSDMIPAWHEYVEAFTGKRMLTWTPGLKDHFGVRELSDDDLAAEGRAPAPEENQVAILAYEQFVLVTACDRIGAFLAFVAEYGAVERAQFQVDAWIEMNCRTPVASGEVRRRMEGVNRFTVLPPSREARA